MAEVIHPDGSAVPLPEPASEAGYTLDEIKAALGLDRCAMIQQLPLHDDDEVLLMDENAKLSDEPPPLNIHATAYARAHGALMPVDYIVGSVVVAHRTTDGWR